MDDPRREFESRITERAASDPAFREELLRSPKEVLSREFGTKMPEGAEIRVVEETPKTLYVVLPPQTSATGELSEEELEAVAGGGWCFVTSTAGLRGTTTYYDCICF